MVLTVPLPAQRRLTVARTGRQLWWAVWKDDLSAVPSDWDEPPGGAGVREPRRPLLPRRGGAIAVPFDD